VAGTSIIYVRNRRRTQEIANWLLKQGIKADYYHAGLDHQTRSLRQTAWMQNKTRVMVSTNAFGMGINKPDVRSVIHLDLPDDLESYYQEAGRAGRDEKPSYAVVLFDHADLSDLEGRSILQFPEREEIRRVYKAVCNYLNIPIDGGSATSYDFDLVDFCSHFQLEPRITFNCLKLLEMCEYIVLSEAFYLPARLKITTGNMSVYDFQVRNPKYEGLIKAILRSFSGVFDDYVKISETELSRKSGLERKELELQLDYLKQLELLDYIPASDRPRLTLTQPRIEEKDLYLPRTLLEDRKGRYVARMNAFRNFITHPTSCRAMMLLSYFGEINLQRCGTCDTCRDRNKVPLNDLRIEEVRHKILEALGNGPLEAEQLLNHAHGINSSDLQSVMRWMLDAGELGTDAMGRIYLKQE
jgi:ATP-dependent DNA helicase RecQ